MSIGRRLKKLRKEAELTQAKLAKELNIGESTISLYESGNREPDYQILKRIADYFNVSVDYLLELTDEKNPMAKLEKVIPNQVLNSLDDEELDLLINLVSDKQRKVLLRASEGLTDKDLVKAIEIIKLITDDEEVGK
ncbi:helix-turn-helix domain-containing protein [Natroniella acetigena]|uniref:helix-turn-helix domain-containing protein n=1 Tax=Natroniella acetigena TaxID=52004 RepID=UPI00200B7380|nr:helix-turn-helix transcriptional regulator [Natroniella acetigena]MCK8827128.1 helix-turn-helix domain-containing protein [Natroniella acetigena]